MTFNTNLYRLIFSKISSGLTPWFWRKDVFLAYLNSALAPLQTLNTQFYNYVTTKWAGLQYTGQHLALEGLLNNLFDPIARAITITENDVTLSYLDLYKAEETDPSPLSLYLASETNPSPLSLYRVLEGKGGINFTINIPASVSYDEDLLRSKLDFFVTAGRQYNIVSV